jgi:dinuclear metal center YbgI/SA1388 family protein
VADRDEIVSWLDELLEVDAFDDLGPNGLQVPGPREVAKVVTGVSAHLDLFRQAAAAGAQLVLAHHGILWDFQPRRIDERQAARLRLLFDAGLGLAQYHLPLDAHPEHGNNATIVQGLGCDTRAPAFEYHGRTIGFLGTFSGDGVPAEELFARVKTLTGRPPQIVRGGPERVRTIGVVSGGATKELAEAIGRGLDAYLTGEISEHVMADALEGGIHYISAGHYATETFGIRRIGELVAERFGVEHEFIAVPNPV